MLPGLTITVAMRELASRHLSSGSACLSAAFLVFTSMAFGVALGTAVVSGLHHGTPVPDQFALATAKRLRPLFPIRWRALSRTSCFAARGVSPRTTA